MKKRNVNFIFILAEPIITKLDFVNEVEVLKNNFVPIDSYVLHLEASNWLSATVVRSMRRTLKNKYGIEIDLVQTFQDVKDKVKNYEQWIVQHILTTENYLGKTILPFEVVPVIPVVEEHTGESLNKSAQNNSQAEKLNLSKEGHS